MKVELFKIVKVAGTQSKPITYAISFLIVSIGIAVICGSIIPIIYLIS